MTAAPIVTTVQVGRQRRAFDVQASPDREYTIGGGFGWSGRGATPARTLPRAFDDVTRDFGERIYDRMELDPACLSALNVLKASIIEDGLHFKPAIDDERHDGFDRAKEIMDFCAAVIEELDTAIDDVLWDLLGAMGTGYKCAEQIYEPVTASQIMPTPARGRPKRYLRLKALKVKPRDATSFVVDPYGNTLGILALTPDEETGGIPRLPAASLGTFETHGLLLPRSKFAVLSFRPKNNDPRGTSLFRPAYNAWWIKQQVFGEWLKFLGQFAAPSLLGVTAEDAQPDPETQQSAVDQLRDLLLQFRGGTALAVAFGTQVTPLEVSGAGAEAFNMAFEFLNHEIVKAILHQSLATEEGKHMARAAATVHQDTLGLILRQAKKAIQRMIRRDILRPLVLYNFGEQAIPLTPKVTLGEVNKEDIAGLMQGIAALMSANYFTEDQLPELDVRFNFPQRKTNKRVGTEPAAAAQQGAEGDPPTPARTKPAADAANTPQE